MEHGVEQPSCNGAGWKYARVCFSVRKLQYKFSAMDALSHDARLKTSRTPISISSRPACTLGLLTKLARHSMEHTVDRNQWVHITVWVKQQQLFRQWVSYSGEAFQGL